MRRYVSLWVLASLFDLIGSYRSGCVFMDSNGFLSVRKSLCSSIWTLMGPNGSVWVLMYPSEFFWVLLHFYRSLWVFIGSLGSLLVLMRPYVS